HRLSAPTLAEARRSVRQALEFLAGRALADAQANGQRGQSSTPARRRTDDPRDDQPPARRTERSVTRIELPTAPGAPRLGTVPAFRLPSSPGSKDYLPPPRS